VTDVHPSATALLWHKFDELRRAAGDQKAGKISSTARALLDRDVPESTARDWINHRCIPRSELSEERFITVITVLYVLARRLPAKTDVRLPPPERDAWLESLRAAQQEDKDAPPNAAVPAAPAARTEPEPDELVFDAERQRDRDASSEGPRPPTPVSLPEPPGPRRRIRATPGRLAAAAGALAVVAAILLYLVVLKDDDSPAAGTQPAPAASRRGAGWIPTATVTLPNGGPVVACPPPANSPNSVAEAEDRIGYAEYYRQQNLFLLYDNAPDGRSAILELKIPGVLAQADWYNSKGRTCHGRERPLAMVVQPNLLESHHTVQFRVCVGEVEDRGKRPPDDCGPWITDLPPTDAADH
jgi:hypothetical protein